MKIRTPHERKVAAQTKASTALGNANAAAERGDTELAERLYQRAQKWLDEANRLSGEGGADQPRVRGGYDW